MSQGMGLNTDLLAQSLNYHGSELTSVVSSRAAFQVLDPKQLNYQMYTKRSKDITEGRTQRTVLHQFIENKLEALFARRCDPVSDQDPVFKQPIPLLDMWMGERTAVHRNEEFYKKLQMGDVLLCIPLNQVPGGIVLDVLAHMSDRGKINYTGDLKLKAILPNTEVFGDNKPLVGSIYKLCVMSDAESIRPLVTLKWSSVPRQARFLEQKTELGVVHKKDLPSGLTDFLRGHSNFSFKNVIEELESFRSPTGIQEMAADLGIPLQTGAWSLFNGLNQGRYPPEVTADGIERAQMSLMAKQHHSEGIEFYEKNDTFRAHTCFNKALSFDPNHVESLFARGSLYANDMKYPNALEDLKGALRLDPKHQSCIDYTTKVLKILGASLLKSEKLDEAVKLCDSVLEIIPDNQKVIGMKKEILSYKDSSTDSQSSEDEPQQTNKIHSPSKGQTHDRLSRDSSQTMINGANTFETEKVSSIISNEALNSTSTLHSHYGIPSSRHEFGSNQKPPILMPNVPLKVESEHERACREFLEKTKSKRQDSSRYSREYGSSSPERPIHGKSKYRKSPNSYKSYSREKRSPNQRNSRHDDPVRYEDQQKRHYSDKEFGSHENPKWEKKSHSLQDNGDRKTKYERPHGRNDYHKDKDETISKRDQRSRSYEYKKSKRNSSKGERYDSDENSKRESVAKKDHSSYQSTSSKHYRRSKSRSSSVEKKPSKSSKSDKSQPDYVWVEKDACKKSKKKKSKKKSSHQDESSDDYSKSSRKKRHKYSSESSDQSSPKRRHMISTQSKKPQQFSRSFSPNALKAFQISDDEEDKESSKDKNQVKQRP